MQLHNPFLFHLLGPEAENPKSFFISHAEIQHGKSGRYGHQYGNPVVFHRSSWFILPDLQYYRNRLGDRLEIPGE